MGTQYVSPMHNRRLETEPDRIGTMAKGAHHLLRNTKRWREVRAEALERDNYQCVRCTATEELEVDHILKLEHYPQLAYDLDNLQTLCQPCHVEKGKEPEVEVDRTQWINPKYADAFRQLGIL